MLVCERPKQFNFAVFLSAWVNPNYWNYTSERAKYMAEYSKQLTPQIYKSFFENTLDLRKLPAYPNINVPMLAICGSKEVKNMKLSLDMLGSNLHCQAMILPRGDRP